MLSNDVIGVAYTECDKKTRTKKKSNTLPNFWYSRFPPLVTISNRSEQRWRHKMPEIFSTAPFVISTSVYFGPTSIFPLPFLAVTIRFYCSALSSKRNVFDPTNTRVDVGNS